MRLLLQIDSTDQSMMFKDEDLTLFRFNMGIIAKAVNMIENQYKIRHETLNLAQLMPGIR